MRVSRSFLHVVRIADAILFWPAVAAVIYGELSSGPERLFLTFFAFINDKVLHFEAYFVLGAMAAAAFRSRRPVLWAIVGLIVLGGVLEVIQSYVGRDMSFWDELANTAGAISGAAIARLIVERLRRRWV